MTDQQDQGNGAADHATTGEGSPRDRTSATSGHLAPQTIVGERYRLVHRVLTDAAGDEFWSARDAVLPRDIAVTVIPNIEPSADAVTNSLRLGRLGHEGLPQILDMGEAGTASYVAGPWADGATVVDLLADGPTEPVIAARVTAHIADAAAAAHEAGLALGSIHPSLVRVNTDGQMRLSHVVARPDAAPDDDVRALGGLLYLMLTDTWPLADRDAPAHKQPARRQDDVAIRADRITRGTPGPLADVAEKALAGALDAAEIAAALGRFSGATTTPARRQAARRSTTRRRSAAAGSSGAARRGESWSNPLPRRLRKDRRIKLSVAGVMLIALAALAVFTASSVTKQFLAALVAPINASSHEIIESIAPPTTTRTVAAETGSTGPDAGTSSDSTGPTTSAAATPIPVAGATVYDPQGDGDKDYTSYVDRAFDDDASTFWLTWVYKQQLGRSTGGLKDGVGLMLHFDEAVEPGSVTVATTTPGTKVEIRSSAGTSPGLDTTDVLGSATLGENPVSISLSDAPSSEYLLVWITKLAPYQGDDGSIQDGFQSTLAEIGVTR